MHLHKCVHQCDALVPKHARACSGGVTGLPSRDKDGNVVDKRQKKSQVPRKTYV
jgi:hypothetical protein